MDPPRILQCLARVCLAVAVVLTALPTSATTCDEDCHGRCRRCVSYDLGFMKDEKCVIEPQCHLACEAEKKTACLIRTPVPQVPRIPTDPIDLQRQLDQTCKAPFEAFTHPVIAYCANWPGRASDLTLVERAKVELVQLGYAQMGEFAGVDIRWCPINGSGMVPETRRVLLHPDLKNDQRALVSTLGHELHHLRQYRRWGGDDFKCRYSKELASGKGQERANYVEREAYEYEDRIKVAWDQAISRRPQAPSGQSRPRPIPIPPTGQPRFSVRCDTPFGVCLMNGQGPVGDSCWCPSWQGPVAGRVF